MEERLTTFYLSCSRCSMITHWTRIERWSSASRRYERPLSGPGKCTCGSGCWVVDVRATFGGQQ